MRNTFFGMLFLGVGLAVVLFVSLYMTFNNIARNFIYQGSADIMEQYSLRLYQVVYFINKEMDIIYNDSKIQPLLKQDTVSDLDYYLAIESAKKHISNDSLFHSIYVMNYKTDTYYEFGNRAVRTYEELYDKEIINVINSNKTTPIIPIVRKIPNELSQGVLDNVLTFIQLKTVDHNKTALVINLKMSAIASSVFGESECVIIVDNKGDVVENTSDKIDAQQFWKMVSKRNGEKPYFITNIGQNSYFVSYAKMPDYNWTLIRVMPYNDILNQMKPVKIMSILIFLLYTITLIVLLYILVRYMYKPMLNIRTNIERMLSLPESKNSKEIVDEYDLIKKVFADSSEKIVTLQDMQKQYAEMITGIEWTNYMSSSVRKIKDSLKDGIFAKIKAAYDDFSKQLHSYSISSAKTEWFYLIYAIQEELNTIGKYSGCKFNFNMFEVKQLILEKTTVEEIDAEFYRLFEEIVNTKNQYSLQKQNIFVDNIINLIEQQYTDGNLSVTSIAQYYKVSTRHVGDVFKEYTNMTIPKYIRKVRLNKAKELLGNTDYSVDKILSQIGWDNEKHFYTVFKNEFGFTPTQYRNNIKIDDIE